MKTASLFAEFYYSRPDWVDGTTLFHRMIRMFSDHKSTILDIGCGPKNPTTDFLASLAPVVGIDVENVKNESLEQFLQFDGQRFPLPPSSVGMCVSNYVLEHILDVRAHFAEIARVLRPGGCYLFRTPNLWHYVSLTSKLLPHFFHELLANRLRGIKNGHEPYPTVYRANSRQTLERLARHANLRTLCLDMVEREPSYGAVHPLLFYPMMCYERTVNRFESLAGFRVNIFGVMQKPIS